MAWNPGGTKALIPVVDSHLVGVAKPDPAIFRIALERLRSDSRTTVHVGDVLAIDVEGSNVHRKMKTLGIEGGE